MDGLGRHGGIVVRAVSEVHGDRAEFLEKADAAAAGRAPLGVPAARRRSRWERFGAALIENLAQSGDRAYCPVLNFCQRRVMARDCSGVLSV